MSGSPVSSQLKLLLSIMVIITFIFYSVCWNSFFSTMMDFTEIVVNLCGRTSLGLFFRSAGSCLGALLGLFLYNIANRETIYAIFLMLMGLGSILIANVFSLFGHQFLNAFIGITVGVIEVGGNMTIMTLWREKSGPWLQALSFFWTIAAAGAPQFFRPFLSKGKNETDSDSENVTCTGPTDVKGSTPQALQMTTTLSTSTVSGIVTESSLFYGLHSNNTLTNVTGAFLNQASTSVTAMSTPDKGVTRIWIPYTLIGFTLVFSGFLVLIIPIYLKFTAKKPEKPTLRSGIELEMQPKSSKETAGSAANKQKPVLSKPEKRRNMGFAALACLLLFIFYGFSDCTMQYWVYFVQKRSSLNLHQPKEYGVHMLTVMNICFALTNFAGIFLSMKFKPYTMLCGLTTLILIGNILHFFFANSSVELLWAGAVIESIGFGCIYACTFYLLETNLPNGVTDTIGSLLVFSAWLANAVGYSLVVGYFIERHSMVLIYTNLGSTIIIVLILIGLHFLNRSKKTSEARFTELPTSPQNNAQTKN